MKPPRKVLRRNEVRARTGLSATTIYREIQAGRFPKPVSIGQRAVGWFEDEVDNWLDQRQVTTPERLTRANPRGAAQDATSPPDVTSPIPLPRRLSERAFPGGGHIGDNGLTIREYAAIHTLQGLLAMPIDRGIEQPDPVPLAIRLADRLLARLAVEAA